MFTFLHPMLVDREESPRLIDVLDRCLDRGIVIDAWVRVSVVGLELLTVESRVVVASIETFLGHAQPLTETQSICARLGSASRPCDRAAPDREH